MKIENPTALIFDDEYEMRLLLDMARLADANIHLPPMMTLDESKRVKEFAKKLLGLRLTWTADEEFRG